VNVLPFFSLACLTAAAVSHAQTVAKPHFDPRTYGAKADGTTFDTEALQKAIDACAGTGGRVVLAGGTFLTKPLELRGHMTFYIEKGAVLLGSPNLEDYPVKLPEKPTSKDLCRSLLYACHADGLTIDGAGEIDGRCKEMNMPPELRKWGTEAKRPSLLRVFRSKDVTMRNITLRNPCMWTQIYSECDNLLVDNVTVDAPPDCKNLDGIDICDSKDVIIRNCNIRSEDDSICLKSLSRRGLQNILVENNRIHCYAANAIKLGSATVGPVSNMVIRNNRVDYAKLGGVTIASVDGSVVRDVLVQDLELHEVGQPIFVRLGQRATGKPVGSIDGVTIERVRAFKTHGKNYRNVAVIGESSITGIPSARVRNVVVRDCYLEAPGGIQQIPNPPAEDPAHYPQSDMHRSSPGYAFFIRNADGVVLKNVTVAKLKPDARPWLGQVNATVETPGCSEADAANQDPQPDAKSFGMK
jgi:polygalacturonase